MAKRLSRAQRLADSMAKIQEVLNDLNDLTVKIPIKKINEYIQRLDLSEIENLRDEIAEWKSNIEEKFSSTQKYSDLEECENSLESALSDLESGSEEIKSKSEVEDRISSLEQGISQLEDVSFPGMFG